MLGRKCCVVLKLHQIKFVVSFVCMSETNVKLEKKKETKSKFNIRQLYSGNSHGARH